jgi:hypothetical protein
MGAVEQVYNRRSGGRRPGHALHGALSRMRTRMYAGSAFVVLVALLGAVLLVVAAPPSRATASARIPQSALPPGSTVQLYPTYPNASDAGTPNGLAAVGQYIRANIAIPQPYSNPSWTSQGFYIDLYLAEVHHEGASCAASPPAIQVDRQLNGGGNELLYSGGTESWPAAANSTAYGSPYYALCTHVEIPPNQASQFSVPDYFTGGPADINTDNHIYKVISDHAPTATPSATTIAQGQTLTVTGHNWIPVYPDQPDTRVGVYLYEIPQPGVEVDFTGTQPPVDAMGNFSISFPITSVYPPGRYYYAAVGSANVNLFGKSGIVGPFNFQVVASQSGRGSVGTAPTATANPTGSPTALAAATASPTTTPMVGGASSHTSMQPPVTPGTSWSPIFLAAGVALLLGGGGAAAYFVAQTQKRRKRMFDDEPT